MSKPNPSTAVVAGGIKASTWNTDVRDGTLWLLSPPTCHAYDSSGNVTVTATWKLMALDQTLFNYATSMHSNSTNNSRITIPETGRYRVDYCVKFPSNASGVRQLEVRMNAGGAIGSGTYIHDQGPIGASSGAMTIGGSRTFTANAGDYLELFAYQSSGGNLTTVTGDGCTAMSVTWISA